MSLLTLLLVPIATAIVGFLGNLVAQLLGGLVPPESPLKEGKTWAELFWAIVERILGITTTAETLAGADTFKTSSKEMRYLGTVNTLDASEAVSEVNNGLEDQAVNIWKQLPVHAPKFGVTPGEAKELLNRYGEADVRVAIAAVHQRNKAKARQDAREAARVRAVNIREALEALNRPPAGDLLHASAEELAKLEAATGIKRAE